MKTNAVAKDLVVHQKVNANAEKLVGFAERIVNVGNVKIFKDERWVINFVFW